VTGYLVYSQWSRSLVVRTAESCLRFELRYYEDSLWKFVPKYWLSRKYLLIERIRSWKMKLWDKQKSKQGSVNFRQFRKAVQKWRRRRLRQSQQLKSWKLFWGKCSIQVKTLLKLLRTSFSGECKTRESNRRFNSLNKTKFRLFRPFDLTWKE